MKLTRRLRRLIDPRHRLGAQGERVAARHLRREGFLILQRNGSAAGVEIDLLAAAPDGRTIVVVEVKTRAPREDARPDASLCTRTQRERLARAAAAIRQLPAGRGRPVRVDLVIVEASDDAASRWRVRRIERLTD